MGKKIKLGILGLMTGIALTLSACGGGGGGGGGTGDGQAVADLSFDVKILQSFLAGAFGAGIDNNNSGQVVGMSDNGSSIRAARWVVKDANPQPTALEPLAGGEYSAAYGINDQGIAIGESEWDTRIVAVYWGAGETQATALATLGSAGFSAAYSINEVGQIVGEEVVDAEGNPVAIFWENNGAAPVNLGTLGGEFSSAYFVSNDGAIVGEAEVASGGEVHAALWLPAAAASTYLPPVSLPPLGGHIASVAFGIDGSGRVVGESQAADGSSHGVIWTVNTEGAVTTVQDLGADTSLAGANTLNHAVGRSLAATGAAWGTIWNSGNPEDVKIINAPSSQAYAVNDTTQIVGMSESGAFVALPQ